ncbi:MAG: aminoacyl-tRNA hydrolase [Gammaproteobacteria bacterium]|nr:aminoacyl-tRNA hydrolase [Gammaproteobacteria bacterium]
MPEVSSAIRLIVGLGNPGPQYEETRHNAGAWFVHELAKQSNVVLRLENKFFGFYAKLTLNQKECQLLIPTTFMNRSGASVAAVIKFYKIVPQEILVVHDELDLPTGAAKLKQGGGHAGHNGLRDIISALGTADFLRLRLGIDRPADPARVSDYVLSRPNKIDEEKIKTAIHQALSILPDLMEGKVGQAMKTLHSTRS